MGHGIANSITNKGIYQIEQLEAQALMIAELANSMKDESQKQFKEMMAMFKESLEKISTSPTNPKNKKVGADKKKKKCPHCGLEVYHKPKACFKLEVNATTTKRPAGWTSKKNT